MLTRKHFKAIADAINEERQNVLAEPSTGNRDLVVYHIARNIADVLQAENPMFDRQRFYEACGVNEGRARFHLNQRLTIGEDS